MNPAGEIFITIGEILLTVYFYNTVIKYMKRKNDIKTNELKLDEFIDRKIKEEDITLATLSRKTGVPRSTLHMWSIGRSPSGKNFPLLSSLCEYFKVSMEELLFNKRDKNATEILFSSKFKDGNEHYHLMIEKIKDK